MMLRVPAAMLLAALSFSADAADARLFRLAGPVAAGFTEVTADGWAVWSNAPLNTIFTVQTATGGIAEPNWVDWVRVPVSNALTVHRLFDPHPPEGMAFIPGGLFMMGNAFADEGSSRELPVHPVEVAAFYMDRGEVTQALWNQVRSWSAAQGYSYDNPGAARATNHPIHSINWHDAVKWCNARSQREGLTPCYYTDQSLTLIYKTGQTQPHVKWEANGYRLPTEAEWEKAARGGATGRRFPWNDSAAIQHGRANYFSSEAYAYDTSTTRGLHPAFSSGGEPHTNPAGYFPPNEYGLHDMAGNVLEWCWDWYSAAYYSVSPSSNPRGPATGTRRVLRGGYAQDYAYLCRVSSRVSLDPAQENMAIGFRTVRAALP